MPAQRRAAEESAEPRRPRRFPASYKVRILQEYDDLDRRGRTALLQREELRASQISQWRAQVYDAALEALSADPGGQPVRRIHVSDPVWADLTAMAAAASPPMSPERLARALFNVATGRESRLTAIPGLLVEVHPAPVQDGQPAAG